MFILSLLLTGSLALQNGGGTRAEAERLARDGSYEDALERFRELAAGDPRDVESRMWIGRLHLWMGHPQDAEAVLRGVLASAPSNLEAMVALGSALTSLGRLDEAVLVLGRAETLAPDNAQVMAAQGRAQSAAGRVPLALAYYRRAALLSPDNREIRHGLEQARRIHGHRVQGTFYGESFTEAVPETRSGDITFDFRMNESMRILARGQRQRKFARDETRAGGGFAWRGRRGIAVRAEGMAGRNVEVLPQADAHAELEYSTRVVDWMAGARFVHFASASEWIISPGVTLRVNDRLSMRARYDRSLTSFSGFEERVSNNSGSVGLSVQAHRRLRLDAGYARGIENFDALSIDRVGRFLANTVSGGARLDLPSLTSLAAVSEYQRRADGATMVRVTASFIQRF